MSCLWLLLLPIQHVESFAFYYPVGRFSSLAMNKILPHQNAIYALSIATVDLIEKTSSILITMRTAAKKKKNFQPHGKIEINDVEVL